MYRLILILLISLTGCTASHVCTHSVEELTIIDTTVLEIEHYNIGAFCFPAVKDTLIDETILTIDNIKYNGSGKSRRN